MKKGNSIVASFAVLFGLFLIGTACSNFRIFEENKKIEGNEWSKFDTLRFYVNITDTADSRDIYVSIRNSNDYQFSNMFVFVKTIAPGGNFIKDTLEITLADKAGIWLGKGIGDVNEVSQVYKKNVRFALPGIYTFEYVQGMRSEPLLGVLDVGIRIVNSD